MRFSSESIDLIETSRKYTKAYGSAPVSRMAFGLQAVSMAHEAIGRTGIPIEELPGIKKCLIHVAGRIWWRNYIWFLPLPHREVPFGRGVFGGYSDSDKLHLLVDSLMLTVLAYQKSLWQFESNLAQILLHEMLGGFERVCDWIHHGAPISEEENELVALIRPAMIDPRIDIDRREESAA
jgi:hypothetical protein